jgi:hypothetical protein
MLKEYGCDAVDPEAVFGTSEFDIGRAEQAEYGSAYRPGSFQYQKFRLLSERDFSFRRYLSTHDIDLRTMHSVQAISRFSFLFQLLKVCVNTVLPDTYCLLVSPTHSHHPVVLLKSPSDHVPPSGLKRRMEVAIGDPCTFT